MEDKNQKLVELENKECLDSMEDIFRSQGQDRVSVELAKLAKKLVSTNLDQRIWSVEASQSPFG